MLFNSLDYLIFLPVVFAVYYSCPQRFKWIILLSASYFFYMCWRWDYVILIIISTLLDFFVGIRLYNTKKHFFRRLYLLLSFAGNIGLLVYFKYSSFIIDNLNVISYKFNLFSDLPRLDILLPVGISFYTFQTLSYTIDLFNRKIEPERHLGRFAVFVSFFPQLVAGPIERASHLLPEIAKKRSFNYTLAVSGLRLILVGLFKKIVVADRLSIIVDQMYAEPSGQNGFSLLLATYFFAFQIYCDFSGYSDIAIGSARLFNISLMENFRAPYFSKSISEFWSRWHISLSSWFRDYVYIPLGGNRRSPLRVFLNIYIVFVVSGFWHGANWTFVMWGAIHGIFLITERMFKTKESHLWQSQSQRSLSTLICFHLVLFSWIFFRSQNLGDAFIIIDKIASVGEWKFGIEIFVGGSNAEFISQMDLILSFFSILVLIFVDVIWQSQRYRKKFFSLPQFGRWTVYLVFVLMIVILGNHGETEFIYFQF